MIILDHQQIQYKIKRMAMEIYEKHADHPQIILAGVNHKGYRLAYLLKENIEALSPLRPVLCNVWLNPADPLGKAVETNLSSDDFKNKVIILIDDVGNTGRTIFYAFKAFLNSVPKEVEVALLLERMHKSYPVQASYVGLKLATTTKENIEVTIEEDREWRVELN